MKRLSIILVLSMGITLSSAVASAEGANPYKDHVPGEKNVNLIPVDSNNSPTRTFVNGVIRNSTLVSLTNGTDWKNGSCHTPKILSTKVNVGDGGLHGLVGMTFKNVGVDNVTVIPGRPIYDVNKSYVFSARIKKTTDNEVRIGLALTNETIQSVSFSKEYGSNGMELTKEYQDFNVTFKPATTFNSEKVNSLVIGFPEGTLTGSEINLDATEKGSVYLAEEQAYDISVDFLTDKKELVEGETAMLSAEVINQIGIPGYLKQNFSWYAMNTERTEIIDGIEISENGNTADIAISDAAPGEYDIVAVSEDYSIARGIRITVKESKEEKIEELSLEQFQKNVIMNVTVKNVDHDNACFTLAEFSGDVLVSVKMEKVDLEGGKARKTVILNNVKDGNVVRAFIWNGSLKPIKNLLGLKTRIKVSSLNELYGSELDKKDFEETDVSEFYNNKKAAVSITFDDGIYSAAEYYNSLFKQYNIHGTAVMVSDWVKEAEIPKWKALFDGGYIDLANHSKSHSIKYKNDNPSAEVLAEDITGGYDALKAIFPNEEIIAFAAPWTQKTDASTAEIKKKHYANRGGGTGFVSSDPTEATLMNLPGFVVENSNTIELLNGKIDTAITNRQWFIHLMHGVGSGTYNIDKTVCAEHFAYIGSKSEDVWAGSLNEVLKYIYEKQNVTIETNWIREKAVSLSVSDTLDDSVFNFPLTLKVNVPSGWEKVRASQNGESITVNMSVEGEKAFVYVNAIPDKGEVLLEGI